MKTFIISVITAYTMCSHLAQGSDFERLKRKKPSYEASGVKVYELTPFHATRSIAVAATSTIRVPMDSIGDLFRRGSETFDQWVPNLKSTELTTNENEQTQQIQQKNAILTGVYHSIFRLHSMIWDIDSYTRFKIEKRTLSKGKQNEPKESWMVISGLSIDRPVLPNLARGSLNRLEIWLKESEDATQTDVMISFDVTPGCWLPPVSIERLKKGYLVQLIKAIERHATIEKRAAAAAIGTKP